MSALAQFSGTRLAAIGYDCIPIVSADLVPTGGAFIEYLNMIKQAARVAGISTSATIEFQGFVDMLPAQGLKGPVVECVELGGPRPTNRPSRRALRERPMVLMVGSLEPRKNQLTVLHAAEKLWRGGLDFELTFICGSEWGTEIPDRIDELTRAGRSINVHRHADSIALEKAYHAARFTVFPSKHEGYGLPVVESLAAGTPVITSNFGCMLALAAQGGALVVDPEDDASLEAAMRTLLTDDDTIEELRAQIPGRPHRDWDDYANELWSTLVAPLLTLDESSPS
jgi:glycosyltransferase involved in cell wall biosynthesis